LFFYDDGSTKQAWVEEKLMPDKGAKQRLPSKDVI